MYVYGCMYGRIYVILLYNKNTLAHTHSLSKTKKEENKKKTQHRKKGDDDRWAGVLPVRLTSYRVAGLASRHVGSLHARQRANVLLLLKVVADDGWVVAG